MGNDRSSARVSLRALPQELILATKLYIPDTPPHLVPRQRLMQLLDQGLSSRLILISAPAGFGKTTLVSQWIAGSLAPPASYGLLPSSENHIPGRANHPTAQSGRSWMGHRVAWLSLDESDNDPARFFRYLIAALQQIVLAAGQHAQAMAQAPHRPSTETLLTSLINDIASVPSPFVLVLDDYHSINSLAVHQNLGFLVEHQPPQMHLIIISREDPPLPLSRLRARGHLAEIRQADLQFTADETAEFLRQAAQADLDPEDLAALHRRTEGSIAGLQFLALSIRGHEDARRLVQSFTGSSRYVLDYLIEEVLQRQSASVQDFLLKTSVLDRLTAPLCDAVTGRQDSLEVSLALERANLFIVPLDQSRRWYRYHHLFGDLLRHRLELEARGSLAVLHGRACRWFSENGFLADAIHHALAAGEWQQAADLIVSVNGAMLKRGEIATVLGWFAALPTDFVRARPHLCHEYSWPLLLAGQIDAAESFLALAENGAGEDSALLGWIASGRAYAARVRGDGRRAVELSVRSLALVPADDWDTRSVVGLNLGMAYWYAGNLDQAQRALGEAQIASQRCGNLYSGLIAHTFLARVQAARGRLQAATTAYRQIIRDGEGLPMTTMAHADLARLLLEQNDLEAAAHHAQQAVALGKTIGNPEYYLASVRTLALVRLAQGDKAAARRGLEESKQLAQEPGISQLALHYALAYHILIAVDLQDLDEASHLAGKSPPLDVGLPVTEYAILSLAQARLLLAEGRRSDAAEILSKRYDIVSQTGFLWYAAETRILQTVAAETTSQALAWLAEALPLAEREGCIRTFVDLGEPMAVLLKEAAAQRVSPAYIGRLLAAFRAEKHRGQAGPPAHIEQPLVEPLSDRELDVLRMLAEHTNQEIAAALFISDNTVKAHLKSIYGKLNVTSRHEATARARSLGLIC